MVAASLLCASPAAAQAPVTLEGRVIDLDDAPVGSQPVALHQITGEAGMEIARATTDGAGRFDLTVPAEADPNGLFFALTRYDGKLYIGRAFQISGDIDDYLIRVGGEGALSALTGGDGSDAGEAPGAADRGAAPSGARQAPPAQGPADGNDGAQAVWAAGGIAVAVTLLLGLAWRVQSRPPLRRRLLLELAELEERDEDGLGPEERKAVDRQRRALRSRLRETAADSRAGDGSGP